MKRVFSITIILLLLVTSNGFAMDVEVWQVVETQMQAGSVIERKVVDVYRTQGEAAKNVPDSYTIPERIERVTIPARTETTYLLDEMQNSGSGWHRTGRQRGPYNSRAEAMRNNPGTRTETSSGTRYYIRELYRDNNTLHTRTTGKTEGPFASRSAAQSRANRLGSVVTQTTYTGSLYFDEGFNRPGIRPDLYVMPTLVSRRNYSSLSTARSEIRYLLDRTHTAGTFARSEPVPSVMINIFGQVGVIPSRASLSYSGYKLIALGRIAAYVGLVTRSQTEVGRYFWETYSTNTNQTINYRWDVKTEINHIPEQEDEIVIPPIDVTYDMVKETVSVDVMIYLTK